MRFIVCFKVEFMLQLISFLILKVLIEIVRLNGFYLYCDLRFYKFRNYKECNMRKNIFEEKSSVYL